MNNTNSQKYGFPPETVENKTLSDNIFREIYDFHRLIKVQMLLNINVTIINQIKTIFT